MTNTIHLLTGTIIDSQNGFVDTFNQLVDFCENLKVEEPLKLENADGVHPVIIMGELSSSNELSGDFIKSVESEATGIIAETDGDGNVTLYDSDTPYLKSIENGATGLDITTDENGNVVVVDSDTPYVKSVQTTASGLQATTDENGNVTISESSTPYIKSISFASASDSNVQFNVSNDGHGNYTVTIGVYYR